MTHIRRVMAAVLSVSLATTLASCGGRTDGPATTSSAAANREVSLRDALLVDADLPGWKFQDNPIVRFTRKPTEPATCQPVDDMTAGQLTPAPKTELSILALEPSSSHPSFVVVYFAQYDPGDAQHIFASARAAMAACRAGYIGPTTRYSEVTEVPSLTVGDEAFSYHAPGELIDEWTTVVRCRGVLLLFNSEQPGTGPGGRVADDLVTAQVAKLTKLGL